MELKINKIPTNFWPDATLPIGWQVVELNNNNTSETFKISNMTIKAPPYELDQPKLTKLGNGAEVAAAHSSSFWMVGDHPAEPG